jgi:hypothetical protein
MRELANSVHEQNCSECIYKYSSSMIIVKTLIYFEHFFFITRQLVTGHLKEMKMSFGVRILRKNKAMNPAEE